MARNKLCKFLICILVLGGFVVLISPQAHAIPSFARKSNYACSACHTTFPQINAFGRQYKLNGYAATFGSTDEAQVTGEEGSEQVLEKNFPISGLVKLRPFDKKKDKVSKERSGHELEIFVGGGNAAKQFSIWGELEMEDDTGFAPMLGELQAGYHLSPKGNILLGTRSLFMNDPYQTLSNMGKLTRSDRQAVSNGQTSGEALGAMKQNVMFYGTLSPGEGASSLYYGLGVSADTGDAEGEGPKDLSTQVTYDTGGGLAAGLFGDFGYQGYDKGAPGTKVKFSRTGLNLLLEQESFSLRGVFVSMKDEKPTATPVAKDDNNAWYLEGAFFGKKGTKLFVPNLRLDNYETTNGTAEFTELTLNVTHFLTENAKVFLEYWTQTNVPTGATKDNRITLQAEVGF